ncbi:hypothetical protein TYRP_008678 [Tyrophagus putrescentiae]|nr:hypothetical protein TYRP_008678 [Tyrophagus putrescentiae]
MAHQVAEVVLVGARVVVPRPGAHGTEQLAPPPPPPAPAVRLRQGAVGDGAQEVRPKEVGVSGGRPPGEAPSQTELLWWFRCSNS